MLYKDLIAINSESHTQPTLYVDRTLKILVQTCRYIKYLLCFIVLMPTDYMKYFWCSKHAMAQLVEALSYKQKGRGFDSRWCYWKFSLT